MKTSATEEREMEVLREVIEVLVGMVLPVGMIYCVCVWPVGYKEVIERGW